MLRKYLNCHLCFGISEPVPGVCQDKAMGKRLELFIIVIYAVLKCRLCFGFQSLNRVCQDSETREVLEQVIKVVCAVQGPKMLSLLGISEPEPGVPGQRDAGVVETSYKSRLSCASN